MGMFLQKASEVDKSKSFGQRLKEQFKEMAANAPLSNLKVEYLGGLADVKKGDCIVNIYKDRLEFKTGFKSFSINLENIKGIEMQSEEQINRDVTLTRLVALGIFAFGLKKKTKEIKEYCILRYTAGDMEITAAFKGKQCEKLISEVIKAKSK